VEREVGVKSGKKKEKVVKWGVTGDILGIKNN
jgi:hypothetical protein